ncbi:MAG: phosphoenolpyruvate mutase [Deltaproteobacteria bacterium RIFOXYA12_FULL_58_15]|nr:MAG: phosphoenolpyruvate mutase [Deltaproteobacteria bacterium RIFOXYA12_FULL_58_15]
MSRAKKLKELLTRKETTILMEAHNGLSAKLCEEAGFEAIWGSGLSISAALGVRDSNEASWTQVLDVLEFMADAASIPILLDGDTGYGNFNNVRRLIKKLEQRNVAGVCLEDKLFPKTNSFIDGEKQRLAAVDEFCGKIRAAKDTQQDPDFVVVARTEAFIAGWGLEEALLRATAYAENGADAILVHSKRKDSNDIMSFMENWKLDVPVVIVPTKYPTEPLAKLEAAGVTNFIFANHSLRTVITALQTNLRKLYETRDLMSVQNDIVKVDEVFRLQNVQELKRSEQRYLPDNAANTRAVVLMASKGDFGDLVADKPKAMLRLHGKPILIWHQEAFRRQGIVNVAAVRGYRKEAVNVEGLHYFDNDDFASTGELSSLYAARDFLRGDMIVAYGDIVFDDFILQNLMTAPGAIKIAVDAAWKLRARSDAHRDLVITDGDADPLRDHTCRLLEIGSSNRAVSQDKATGEWIGLLYLSAEKTGQIAALLDGWANKQPEKLKHGDLPMLLNHLVASGETISVVHSYGHWRDLDDQKDLLAAQNAEQPN